MHVTYLVTVNNEILADTCNFNVQRMHHRMRGCSLENLGLEVRKTTFVVSKLRISRSRVFSTTLRRGGGGGRTPSIRSFVPRIACRRTVARPTVNHRRYIVYGWKYLRNIGIHGQRATFLAILKSVDHETVEIRTDTNFKTENIQSVYE